MYELKLYRKVRWHCLSVSDRAGNTYFLSRITNRLLSKHCHCSVWVHKACSVPSGACLGAASRSTRNHKQTNLFVSLRPKSNQFLTATEFTWKWTETIIVSIQFIKPGIGEVTGMARPIYTDVATPLPDTQWWTGRLLIVGLSLEKIQANRMWVRNVCVCVCEVGGCERCVMVVFLELDSFNGRQSHRSIEHRSPPLHKQARIMNVSPVNIAAVWLLCFLGLRLSPSHWFSLAVYPSRLLSAAFPLAPDTYISLSVSFSFFLPSITSS